ncbi:MAG: hypothetical protein ACT4PM_13570 [Gemmatimonadales bacterium]
MRGSRVNSRPSRGRRSVKRVRWSGLLLAGLLPAVLPSGRPAVLFPAIQPSSRPAVQAPPGTDIYLVPLARRGAELRAGTPVNLTARAGYDNQPSFSPDGRSLYYTSAREGQTDIVRYDLDSRRTTQVLSTSESEYSPTVMPDGQHLSVVRVERDSTQRLWQFTLAGTAPKPVLEAVKPVGYHAWLNADTVFVFVLGTPATLQRADVRIGTAIVVARDIGRGLAKIPGRHAVSYVQRDSAGGAIHELDPVSGRSGKLAPLPERNEFFGWTPAGELLSASGNALLWWRSDRGGWNVVTRFTEPGLQRISRIAVSPRGDFLALVGEDNSRPPGNP